MSSRGALIFLRSLFRGCLCLSAAAPQEDVAAMRCSIVGMKWSYSSWMCLYICQWHLHTAAQVANEKVGACRSSPWRNVLVAKESSSLTHWKDGIKTGSVSNLIASIKTEKGKTGSDTSPGGIVFLYSLTCFQALSNTPVLFPARLLQRWGKSDWIFSSLTPASRTE